MLQLDATRSAAPLNLNLTNEQMAALTSTFTCPVCSKVNRTAVRLFPCGHELHADCAQNLYRGTKTCTCGKEFMGFDNSDVSRQAVAILFPQKTPKALVDVIHDSNALCAKLKPETTVGQLYQKFQESLGKQITDFRLRLNGLDLNPKDKVLSILKPGDQIECAIERLHSMEHANPKILARVQADVPAGYEYDIPQNYQSAYALELYESLNPMPIPKVAQQ